MLVKFTQINQKHLICCSDYIAREFTLISYHIYFVYIMRMWAIPSSSWIVPSHVTFPSRRSPAFPGNEARYSPPSVVQSVFLVLLCPRQWPHSFQAYGTQPHGHWQRSERGTHASHVRSSFSQYTCHSQSAWTGYRLSWRQDLGWGDVWVDSL